MKTRDLENTLNNVQDQKALTQYIQTIQDILTIHFMNISIS